MSDSMELEALFDEVSRQSQGEGAPVAAEHTSSDEVIDRVGRLTRNLHTSLVDLAQDDKIESTAGAIPDVKDRLLYVASMTKQAAGRVLDEVDSAMPVIDEGATRSDRLLDQWDAMFEGRLDVDDFKRLVAETREHLRVEQAARTRLRGIMTEIMLAQDFQDLTGQVIHKVLDAIKSVESELITLLIERHPKTPANLQGPATELMLAHGEAIGSQAEVDQLLADMGF